MSKINASNNLLYFIFTHPSVPRGERFFLVLFTGLAATVLGIILHTQNKRARELDLPRDYTPKGVRITVMKKPAAAHVNPVAASFKNPPEAPIRPHVLIEVAYMK